MLIFIVPKIMFLSYLYFLSFILYRQIYVVKLEIVSTADSKRVLIVYVSIENVAAARRRIKEDVGLERHQYIAMLETGL